MITWFAIGYTAAVFGGAAILVGWVWGATFLFVEREGWRKAIGIIMFVILGITLFLLIAFAISHTAHGWAHVAEYFMEEMR